ncbi:MAG: hypothetical protein RR482_00075 [Clostridia bacterium]
MAKTGLLRPTYAPISSEPENAAIVYTAGKTFAHAIQASVTFSRNDTPLYGDDTIIENDNGVTGVEITMGIDDIPEATQVDMLGVSQNGETGAEVYEVTNESAPYVGFGYIEVKRKDGVVSYLSHWYHKVQFALPDESTNTKGDKLEWQTPTMKGKGIGVYSDASGKLRFRATKPCTTLAAAVTWLNGKAGIVAQGGVVQGGVKNV